jgi:hypothetical protein
MDVHLDQLHVLATVNSASVNMGVHISLQHSDFISLVYTPNSELTGYVTVLLLVCFGGTGGLKSGPHTC